MDLNQFRKDRDEALFSLDEQKILAYCWKYGAPIHPNALVFWASIHKARVALRSIPEAEKELSRRWLLEHGFSTGVG